MELDGFSTHLLLRYSILRPNKIQSPKIIVTSSNNNDIDLDKYIPSICEKKTRKQAPPPTGNWSKYQRDCGQWSPNLTGINLFLSSLDEFACDIYCPLSTANANHEIMTRTFQSVRYLNELFVRNDDPPPLPPKTHTCSPNSGLRNLIFILTKQ